MSKSILVITGDGGECYETLYAVHRMREEGYVARIAAPSRKRLRGEVLDASESAVTVQTDNESVQIPYDEILRGNLIDEG